MKIFINVLETAMAKRQNIWRFVTTQTPSRHACGNGGGLCFGKCAFPGTDYHNIRRLLFTRLSASFKFVFSYRIAKILYKYCIHINIGIPNTTGRDFVKTYQNLSSSFINPSTWSRLSWTRNPLLAHSTFMALTNHDVLRILYDTNVRGYIICTTRNAIFYFHIKISRKQYSIKNP